MFRNGLLLAAAVVSVAGWAVPVQAGFWFDIWGVSADGSMDIYSPDGGYANAGSSGRFILSKSYYHMAYMGFTGLSDGPDKKPPGASGDKGDGVLLADWLVGKKPFGAILYFRDATGQTCDPNTADGTYLNDPVTIVGFRCSNEGEFIDQDHAQPGTSTSYYNPSVGPGDMAAPAWRMGQYQFFPPYGYSQQGAIGTGGAFWQVSSYDSRWPGLQVKVDNIPGSSFNTPGFEGYSGYANRFAFGWMVQKSDAMMVNSGTIGTADCTGVAGELEPRDLAGDGNIAEGWFAKHIDRCIVQDLAFDPEAKGLVFQSVTSPGGRNSYVFSRDGYGGVYAPYLAITATYLSDIDNDGCPDVVDLLWLVQAFGADIGDPWWNPDCDLDCDGAVDVVDLLIFVEQFGLPCLDP
jgi:hypothetical protein